MSITFRTTVLFFLILHLWNCDILKSDTDWIRWSRIHQNKLNWICEKLSVPFVIPSRRSVTVKIVNNISKKTIFRPKIFFPIFIYIAKRNSTSAEKKLGKNTFVNNLDYIGNWTWMSKKTPIKSKRGFLNRRLETCFLIAIKSCHCD